MEIKNLKLINFRNIVNTQIDLTNRLIFIGNNGQGKTNILEAINYLSTLKSFRTSNDLNIVKIDSEIFKIQAIFVKNDKKEDEIEVIYNGKQKNKEIYFNNKKENRISEAIGKFRSTILCSDDINIIKLDSVQRRKFIDILISKIDKIYLNNLINLNKVLKNRNILLKKSKFNLIKVDELIPWNYQLSEFSEYIESKRHEIVNKLNENILNIAKKIDINTKNLNILLKTNTIFDLEKINKETILENLKKYEKIEKIKGFSLMGPHRDDLLITMDGMDSRLHCSQGQQRLIVMILKMAEAELIYEKTQEWPVLLIDDIFAELDEERKLKMIQWLPHAAQVIFTGTQSDDFKFLDSPKTFLHVVNGSIESKKVL
jgi:DNA replication and repair protein RecF